MTTIKCIICSCLFCVLFSCIKSNQFEKNCTIENSAWKYSQQPDVKFYITDTSASYIMYLTMQHTDDYMYNNIWLKLYTQNPGDSVFNTSIIEVPLAETSGKWLGRGFNHTFIHQMLLTNNGVAKFSKVGTYTIKLEQIMRSNPLLHVQSIGIRIEKNNAK